MYRAAPISGIGEPFRGKAGDVGFLVAEVCGGFHGALAYRLSGCGELSAGALGEPADAYGCQCLVGGPELGPRVHAAAFAARPSTTAADTRRRELDLGRAVSALHPVEVRPHVAR